MRFLMNKRPLPISIILLVFFAEGILRFGGSLLVLLISFGYGVWTQTHMLFFVTVSLGNLSSCYGLWKMRKWGIYLFFGVWLSHFIFALILEKRLVALTEAPWGCFMFFISPVLLALVILPYWKRFD